MSDDALRVLQVEDIDNMRGGTQRVIEENSINNMRGVTRRVYVVGGGGGSPVIDELNVTPSTSAQTITASGGVDGYSPVNVSAVDATIDANITAGNIKSGVSILGVTGNLVESNETTLSVTPTTSAQTLTPTSPYTGFNEVSVSAVTSSIDANIQAGNIKKDVQILGVTGTYEGGGGGTYGVPKIIDIDHTLQITDYIIDLTGVLDVGAYALYYAYAKNTEVTTADMSSILHITGISGCGDMFRQAANLASFDLSNLQTVEGYSACEYMFSSTAVTTADLSALEEVSGEAGCQGMFNTCTYLTSADLSALTTISGRSSCASMFAGCTVLATADISALEEITGIESCSGMFNGCSALTATSTTSLRSISGENGAKNMFASSGVTAANLSALEEITSTNGCNNMFYNCLALTSADLSSLQQVTGANGCNTMFYGCSVLTSVNLSSLSVITGSQAFYRTFRNCTSLQSLSFPAVTTTSFGANTNQFASMCQGISGITLHFPSNVQSVIEGLSGYSTTAPFGATSGTVLFDLPATE